ncbi:unnamed protein product [Owenia fusiformis]|uniref:Uncharacterized protein n=1 Tax=Owenia fusiformis TaxID=6347 RepID=A0A8J1UP53_OWEFU|nr:unnamed protein product [Owenia fusiformis]
MATVVPSFSPNGEYFAYASPDGTLKLWDTETGTLKQEFTPSSHLSATCSCLKWGSIRSRKKPKKKRKSLPGAVEKTGTEVLDLLALGTSSGTILLYSVVHGDLHTQLEGGHSDTVTDMCWHPEKNILYSCSKDQHIVEWDLIEGKIKKKWQGDKRDIHSICLCPGQRCLLTAGHNIKLWDLETYELLKTYTGHATDVTSLVCASSPTSQPVSEDEDPIDSVENMYFLSASTDDRIINAWQIRKKPRNRHKNESAVMTFRLPTEPVTMDIAAVTSRDQPLLLGAIVNNGQFVIYEQVLNGVMKKPVKHKTMFQIATQKTKSSSSKAIPILSVQFTNDKQNNILIAHGNFVKPTIEKIPFNTKDEDVCTCLIREDPSLSQVSSEESVNKVKQPGISEDMTTLAPGNLLPREPTQMEAGKRKKRKKSDPKELTIEDRIQALGLAQSGDKPSGSDPPTASTLVHLLIQGLQSKDKKILNTVLQNRNDVIVRNTVKRLPLPAIIPLVNELTRRLHGHATSGHTVLKWLKTVLVSHTSYLMSFPDVVETFSSMYQMMDARVSMFSNISKLQGKLDLMLSQVTSQGGSGEEESGTPTSHQPLLLYQEESSDEEDAMLEDIVVSHSESEDNWEELSDDDRNAMDVENDQGKESEDDSDNEDIVENGNSSSESDME